MENTTKKRNYAKENARERDVYRKYQIKIKKEIAKEFDEKLKAENTNVTKFFNDSIKKFLKK